VNGRNILRGTITIIKYAESHFVIQQPPNPTLF
jgi:hypothetical protein